MSLQITIQVNDQITPHLRRLQAKLNNITPVNRSIGIALAALAKRAFDEPNLRPDPWPTKKDGSTATLRRSGMLWRSLRVIHYDRFGVTIGSDRPYAAIHQLGGHTPPRTIHPIKKRALHWPGAKHPVKSVQHPGSRIPSRPFFPVTSDGNLTDDALQKIRAIITAYLAG